MASRGFGGVDSYYFLLYATDLAQAPSETSFARYTYFPGSYAVWRLIALAAGRDYSIYQYVFAGICIANATLTALVIRAAGGGALLAATAYCCYLLIGNRLDLAEMTTEPLATVPALLGILLWLKLHRHGLTRIGLAWLGVSLGLSVFMKQQGALLALGAIGLAPILWNRSTSWTQHAGDAVSLFLSALFVFSLAMLLDGGGFAALKFGVATAVTYETHANPIINLASAVTRAPTLFAALAASICLLPLALTSPHRGNLNDVPLLLVIWALGAATSLSTLLQFAKRGYAHYALLTLPFALLTATVAARWSWDYLSEHVRLPPQGIAGGFLLLIGMLAFEAAIIPIPTRSFAVPPHQRDIFTCAGIEPEKRLLLLPSRQNALHWACGTNARGTRWGYTFNFQEQPNDYIEELAKPGLDQVFVFNADNPNSYEHEVAARRDWSTFFVALESEGFKQVRQTNLGILYSRTPPVGTRWPPP